VRTLTLAHPSGGRSQSGKTTLPRIFLEGAASAGAPPCTSGAGTATLASGSWCESGDSSAGLCTCESGGDARLVAAEPESLISGKNSSVPTHSASRTPRTTGKTWWRLTFLRASGICPYLGRSRRIPAHSSGRPCSRSRPARTGQGLTSCRGLRELACDSKDRARHCLCSRNRHTTFHSRGGLHIRKEHPGTKSRGRYPNILRGRLGLAQPGNRTRYLVVWCWRVGPSPVRGIQPSWRRKNSYVHS